MTQLPPIKKFVSTSGLRIYRIPCQVFDDLTARVYLVLGAGVPTLIDAGSGRGDCTAQIVAGIEAVGTQFHEPLAVADVRRIIVSHAHLDHFGGLAQLLTHMPAEVLVHPLDSRPLAAWEEHAALSRRRWAQFLDEAGAPPAQRDDILAAARFEHDRLRSVPIGRLLSDGQELDGLRVVHTPGHSSGHVCLVAGNILLAADHILAQTLPQQWPEQFAPCLGLGHYFDSLDKIARIAGLEMALGAHEQVVEHVYRRIEAIRNSHVRKLDRIVEFVGLAAKPLSVYELTLKMYGPSSGFRAVLTISDVGARVEYLHERGKLLIANFPEISLGPGSVFKYGLA